MGNSPSNVGPGCRALRRDEPCNIIKRDDISVLAALPVVPGYLNIEMANLTLNR